VADAGGDLNAGPSTADAVVAGAAERPWSWHLVRVSGLVLFVILPVHVVSTLLLTDVADWSAELVAGRWEDPRWRVLDWSVVVLGLTHAALALGRPLCPTGTRAPLRTVAAIVGVAACALLALAATVVVFSFELG